MLSLLAACVGMSLGVLLPTLFPGVCCGLNLALMVGTFAEISMPLYLPVVGGVSACVGAALSVRYVCELCGRVDELFA